MVYIKGFKEVPVLFGLVMEPQVAPGLYFITGAWNMHILSSFSMKQFKQFTALRIMLITNSSSSSTTTKTCGIVTFSTRDSIKISNRSLDYYILRNKSPKGSPLEQNVALHHGIPTHSSHCPTIDGIFPSSYPWLSHTITLFVCYCRT